MIYILYVLIFLFGASLGSFLNVVIYRMPREMSLVTPRSKCPHCGKAIYWYENIPVISYLFLKGSCSQCGERISIRYPLVELICGVVALVLFLPLNSLNDLYFFSFKFSIFLIFLAQFLIDLEHKLLPDLLNLYLGLIFLSYALIEFSWQYIVLGFLVGGGFPFLVTWAFYKLRGKVGLGGGDIKLYGALGIYLGPVGVIQNIFLSCFLGALVGLCLIAFKLMNKEKPIPFGPFIIIVAVLQIFFPDFYTQVRQLIF